MPSTCETCRSHKNPKTWALSPWRTVETDRASHETRTVQTQVDLENSPSYRVGWVLGGEFRRFVSEWKELGENTRYRFAFLLVFFQLGKFSIYFWFYIDCKRCCQERKDVLLSSREAHCTVLSGGRVHSPESRGSCFSQPFELQGTQIPGDSNWASGVCLGPLGTGMLAKISQTIKIPA